MCIENSRIQRMRRWNWDGEQIIHESIVPSSRPIVGHQKGGYDIDVREFLVSEKNATMRRTLEKDVKKFIGGLQGASWEHFTSRDPGAFDLRVHVITQFVSEKIKYRSSAGLDPWQFPDETLKSRSGDCEDRALLIASLFLASGISSFNVRVALGKFRAWFGKTHADFDHVWVMYKDEIGKWQVIEPADQLDTWGHTRRGVTHETWGHILSYDISSMALMIRLTVAECSPSSRPIFVSVVTW